MKAQIYRESLLGKYIGRWQAYIAGHIVLYKPNLFMKHSLLGWSIERPNIHSRCYSMHYVCIHKPAKQHADASFTQVNDPLTGQLYFPFPIYLVGSAKMLAAAYRQKCTLLSRARHCN